MKRVILDENLPHPLLNQLTTHEFSTVQHEGWTGRSNGDLLQLLEQARWDVFVTSDKNLR